MLLPLQQTDNKDLSLIQTKWKSILDPLLKSPTNNISILKDVKLVTGSNSIAHLLQQIQQGWIIIDIQQTATIYRNGPFNDVYLYLSASAPVTVSLGVF